MNLISTGKSISEVDSMNIQSIVYKDLVILPYKKLADLESKGIRAKV